MENTKNYQLNLFPSMLNLNTSDIVEIFDIYLIFYIKKFIEKRFFFNIFNFFFI